MLWVGTEIIAHGIPPVHHALENLEHALAAVPAAAWLTKVIVLALGGLILGAIIEKLVSLVRRFT